MEKYIKPINIAWRIAAGLQITVLTGANIEMWESVPLTIIGTVLLAWGFASMIIYLKKGNNNGKEESKSI